MQDLLPVLVLGTVLLPASSTLAQGKPRGQEREEEAVAALEKLRGFVDRDERAPGRPITGITIDGPVKDEDLDVLKAFPHLVALKLYDAGGISETGLARLCALSGLEDLYVARAPMSDTGLAAFRRLTRLKRLLISDVPITDAGLAHLEGMGHLREITFCNTSVTDAGVARLKQALPYALIDNISCQTGGTRRWASPEVVGVLGALGVLGPYLLLRWRLAWLRRRLVGKLAVLLALVVGMGAALLWLAPRMCPVQDGEPAVFWFHACRLDVGLKRLPGGLLGARCYPPRDGWMIYSVQGLHGERLHRVKAADVEALLPRVVEKLRNAPAGLLHADVETGFREWQRLDSAQQDATALVVQLREARLARLRREAPGNRVSLAVYQNFLSQERELEERRERIGRYPLCVVLEFIFFAGLILFGAWPWLRGAGRLAWAFHLGWLPVLLFLPFWLGYAPLTFTSAGPGGGVLYPHVIIRFRGLPWTSLDATLLNHVPQPLEPLADSPGTILALTGLGTVGPVAVVVLAVLLGALVFIAATVIARKREWTVARAVASRRDDGRQALSASAVAGWQTEKGRMSDTPG